jgi:hypothetical protein
MALLQHPLPGYPTPTNGHFGAPRGWIGGVNYGAHKGHDWSAPTGTPVRSAGVGVVTHVGGLACPFHIGAGHHLIVAHGSGIESRYVHLSAKYVGEGRGVLAGQAIGAVGATGTATGAHLHFEVVVNGVHVDPLPFIGLAPATAASGVTADARPKVCLRMNEQTLRDEKVPMNADGTCPAGTRGPFNDIDPLVPTDLPSALGFVIPPLLEPALNIAILGVAALLVWAGAQQVLGIKVTGPLGIGVESAL